MLLKQAKFMPFWMNGGKQGEGKGGGGHGLSGEEHEKLLNLRHLKYLLVNPIFIAKRENGNGRRNKDN